MSEAHFVAFLRELYAKPASEEENEAFWAENCSVDCEACIDGEYMNRPALAKRRMLTGGLSAFRLLDVPFFCRDGAKLAVVLYVLFLGADESGDQTCWKRAQLHANGTFDSESGNKLLSFIMCKREMQDDEPIWHPILPKANGIA